MNWMNLATAWTEPLVQMHRSHETLNELAKFGAAAFHGLRSAVNGEDGAIRLTRAINATGEPWAQDIRYDDPSSSVERTLDDFASLCLVQGMAGFDRFTESLIEEVCRCDHTAQSLVLFKHAHSDPFTAPSNCCEAHAGSAGLKHGMRKRVESFCAALGVVDSSVPNLLPIFHFFRKIRNCLAHDGGFADGELENLALSPALNSAWTKFATDTRTGKIPNRPSFVVRQKIRLRPSHAVLAAVVCHRLANRLNQAVVTRLGLDGLVRMACYHGLGRRCCPLPTRSKTIASPVTWILHDRYRVVDVSPKVVRNALDRLGLTSYCQARRREAYDQNGRLLG